MKSYPLALLERAKKKDEEKTFLNKRRSFKARKKQNLLNIECLAYIEKNKHRRKVVPIANFHMNPNFSWNGIAAYDYVEYSLQEWVEMFNQAKKRKVRYKDIEKIKLLEQ